LAKEGELEFCRHAPLFWIDSADVGPTIGTAGVMTWECKVTGFSGHSGVPQNAVNALSLSMRAIEYIQKRFYSDFPYSHEAHQWQFSNGSSLKPTRCEMPPGGVTNIPREVTLKGDIRFLPFVTEAQVKAAVEGYVSDLNESVIRHGGLPGVGGVDRFVIPDPVAKKRLEEESSDAAVPMLQGIVEWKWSGHAMRGVACDLESTGFKALCDAIYEVTGQCKPFALTGSLPIIAGLKEQGFDTQITGFGAFDGQDTRCAFLLSVRWSFRR
jgi:acetylornithine deacetylase